LKNKLSSIQMPLLNEVLMGKVHFGEPDGLLGGVCWKVFH